MTVVVSPSGEWYVFSSCSSEICAFISILLTQQMSEDDRPISNLPYDESVDVSDAEDVPTALSITPRAPAQHMPISHCSDEEEEDEDEDEDDDVQTG